MEIIDFGSIVFGLIILCIGGYAIVSGGVSLAKRLKISSMIIGLTVVAYGTSTPELAAAILAALNSHTELILGNIIGSNIRATVWTNIFPSLWDMQRPRWTRAWLWTQHCSSQMIFDQISKEFPI